MEFIAMDIECTWQKPPGWFRKQPRETKARYIAFRRIKLGIG